MNKLFYYLGIYSFCIMVYELPDNVMGFVDEWRRRKRKFELERKERKEVIGIKPEPAHKPLDRIGF